MSTFTTRAGATTCDRCKGRVGSTWRERAQHLCPRIVPDPFAKACAYPPCGGLMHPREGESTVQFAKRRCCSHTCAQRLRRSTP